MDEDIARPVMSEAAADDAVAAKEASLNTSGLISLCIFYLIVLGIGVWAGWKQRREIKSQGRSEVRQEDVMVAGRNMGYVVGILTMAGTVVGGGYINGSAEITFDLGLVWNQAPFGYSLSLILGGLLFARRMRESRYVTLMDPFTCKYGKWGALHALPPVLSEIFWTAAILSALGSTLRVILDIDRVPSIIASAVISVLYTLIGGLTSVAYTDVFQISFIGLGLVTALPFAMNHAAVSSISTVDWIGSIGPADWGSWMDTMLLLTPGGIPWQGYFQRVLSAKTSKHAMVISVGGGCLSALLAIPPSLFGAVAKATDWSETVFGHRPEGDEIGLVLPLSLKYLTPSIIAFFGLGAVSAAVMSSTDSAMLSAASLLSRNVYKPVFRPKASDKEVLIVLWLAITINGTVATIMAIQYTSIYGLFVLVGDALYLGFPQFIIVLYLSQANNYGAIPSWIFCIVFRFLCGDPTLGITDYISFGTITDPNDPTVTGPVPYRTIVVILTFFIHLTLSLSTHYLFTREVIPLKYDFLGCFRETSHGTIECATTRFLPENDDDLDKNGTVMPMQNLDHRYHTKDTGYV